MPGHCVSVLQGDPFVLDSDGDEDVLQDSDRMAIMQIERKHPLTAETIARAYARSGFVGNSMTLDRKSVV